MPTLPYVENGCQVAIAHLVQAQECLVTFHALGPLGFSNEDLDSLCEIVGQRWAQRMFPSMSYVTSLVGVEARGIRYEGDAFGSYTPPTDVDGAISTETERPQEALCIKTETGRTGAGFRGRNFIPGMPTNRVLGGLVDITYRTGVATALAAFYNDVRGMTPFVPVVVSYWREKAIRPVPLATPITNAKSVRRTPSSLASREPGSGS